MNQSKKLAVIFPGIGYTADKPLLYYAARLAAAHGYDVVRIVYDGEQVDMEMAKKDIMPILSKALAYTEKVLEGIDYTEYDDILFLSKSIGTLIAAAYAKRNEIEARHVFYTPLEQTFQFTEGCKGIVFCGTQDTWAAYDKVKAYCEEQHFLLHTVEDGNHSLETGDALPDLGRLTGIMRETENYIAIAEQSIYRIPVQQQDGAIGDLSDYRGQVMLIVNTATGCGFTPQYTFLEDLYRRHKKDGFVILDFPCNQFGRQTPGTNAEIQAFCTSRYDTSFPRYAKTDVNGENAGELFTYLKKRQGFHGLQGTSKEAKYLERVISEADPDYRKNDDIKWNFTKFLCDRDGNVVARYEPTDDLEQLAAQVEEYVGQ